MNWLTDIEVLDNDPKLLEMMKNDCDRFVREKLCPVLNSSRKLNKALDKKDGEFLAKLENVEFLTDPDERTYMEAITGQLGWKNKDQMEEEERVGELSITTRRMTDFLEFMNGATMLYVVLGMVFCACVLLVSQAVVGDEPVLEVCDYVITTFFALEVLSKIVAFSYVHGEIDTFLLDPLNAIDVGVVVVDILFIYATLRGGDRAGGGVKVLRTARVARLLRLIRVGNILKKKEASMTREEASKDKRR